MKVEDLIDFLNKCDPKAEIISIREWEDPLKEDTETKVKRAFEISNDSDAIAEKKVVCLRC